MTNVFFSDESMVTIRWNKHNKVRVCWGDELPEKGFNQKEQSIMVWGAISRRGTTELETIDEGKMNADYYCDFIEHLLVNTAQRLYGRKNKGKLRWRF